MTRRSAVVTLVVFGLLLVSLPGVRALPVGPFIGLDFQYLDAFHDCVAAANPYLASGIECGDALGRDMHLPPPLYWSYAWTRLVPLSTGVVIWAGVIVIGLLLALSAWIPRGQHGIRSALFILLLMLQLPVIFSIERGNNDVIVVVAWTAASLLFLAGRYGLAGFAGGLAVALKIYPVFAVVVTIAGLLVWARRRPDGWLPLARFVGGGIVVALLAGFLFLDQNIAYIGDELPRLIAWENKLDTVSHPLGVIAPGGISLVLSLPLLAMWAVASARAIRVDTMLVLAGGLAISTYFSALSNDYNLITTYPLLLLLFVRASSPQGGWLSLGLLLLGLVAIVGDRTWFAGGDELAVLHTGLQWFWLLATGAVVAFLPRSVRVPGTADATVRADSASVPMRRRSTFSSLRSS